MEVCPVCHDNQFNSITFGGREKNGEKIDAAAYMKKMFMKNHVVFKKFIMQDLTE